MVLDFQSISIRDGEEDEEERIPSPQISVIEDDEAYGKFVIEPLRQGYGMTLGNPLRRVLYSSLPGTAVTWVKIEGVLHEYATIPHIKEEVAEFILNVKGLRLRSAVERPGKLRLEVAGEGEVCAADIMSSTDFEIVNPELHLATLDSAEAKLSVELNVERGTGYVVAPEGDGQPIGVLPVDAVFTPIRKVSYAVEPTRVGQRTDFERLVMEVWTDGSIKPVEAIRQAANLLVNQFYMFANVQKPSEDGANGPPIALRIPAEQYNVAVERLTLSARTLNCLKRAGINKVGEVLEMSKPDLLRIRNFGEKSYSELFGRLDEMDLLPADMVVETSDDLSDDDDPESQSDEFVPSGGPDGGDGGVGEPETEAVAATPDE